MFLSMMSFGMLLLRACASKSLSRALSDPGPPDRTAWTINLQERPRFALQRRSDPHVRMILSVALTLPRRRMETHFPNLPYSFARAPSVLPCRARTTVVHADCASGLDIMSSQCYSRLATGCRFRRKCYHLARRDLC